MLVSYFLRSRISSKISSRCIPATKCLYIHCTCVRSARLVNMAPLVANGQTLQNGEIEQYLQINLGTLPHVTLNKEWI